MLQTLVLEQEFIDKFTEEIITNFASEIKEEIKFEKEMKRAEREVELEKMRQKFSKYGQVSPQMPMVQRPPIQSQSQRLSPQPQNSLQAPAPLPQLPRTQPIQRPPVQEIAIQAKQEDINFFGKIQELINDNLVTYIECPGEDKNVIIRKAGATVSIPVTLKNDEELVIIKSFSEKARIPLIEGMLNARISNLEISAVISEASGSSFIIRKNPVIIQSNAPTRLERLMMQFPQPGAQHPASQPMPPVNRPFTPSAMPQQQFQQPTRQYSQQQNPQQNQQKQENKESFWGKKISFGK